jgi:hypothetical protein
MRNALHRILTISFLLLLGSCGIKWATNKVLTNRSAIEQVGAVYDALTPKDTTERLVFITGDSILVEKTDTIRTKDTLTLEITNTVYNTRTIRRTDTIIRTLPPDNRKIQRLTDSISHYKAITDRLSGEAIQYKAQVKKAENRLIWFAGIVLALGVVIGLLLKFKIYPRL